MDRKRLLHLARKAAGNAKVRYGGAAAGVFAWMGHVSDGFTYWGWLSTNWQWVVDWVRHPLFYWAFAALTVLIFARGLREVAKAELGAADEDAARRKAELDEVREALNAAMSLPRLLAMLYILNERGMAQRARMDEYRRSVREHRDKVLAILGAEHIGGAETGQILNGLAGAAYWDLVAFAEECEIKEPWDFEFKEPEFTYEPQPGILMAPADKNQNRQFLKAHREMVDEFQKRSQRLTELAARGWSGPNIGQLLQEEIERHAPK